MTGGDCKGKHLRGSRRSKCGAAPRGNSELALALHRSPGSMVDFVLVLFTKEIAVGN